MIRMVLSAPGGEKKTLLLGLSEGNLMRLREKKPIVVEGTALGVGDLLICITWGETEEQILDDVRQWADSRGVTLPPIEDLRVKEG